MDLHVDGQDLSYIDRILTSKKHEGTAFRVRAWAVRRRFSVMEEEMRRALDSFRILG